MHAHLSNCRRRSPVMGLLFAVAARVVYADVITENDQPPIQFERMFNKWWYILAYVCIGVPLLFCCYKYPPYKPFQHYFMWWQRKQRQDSEEGIHFCLCGDSRTQSWNCSGLSNIFCVQRCYIVLSYLVCCFPCMWGNCVLDKKVTKDEKITPVTVYTCAESADIDTDSSDEEESEYSGYSDETGAS